MKKFHSLLFLLALFLTLLPLYLKFDSTGALSRENRYLATLPELPSTLDGMKVFAKEFEVWLKDRMGYRDAMIAIHKSFLYHGFNQLDNEQVTLGQNGSMFFINNGQPASHRYLRIIQAYQIEKDYQEAVEHQLQIIREDAEFIRSSQKHILLLAIPTSPVFNYENLPYFLKKFIPENFRKKLPIEAALEKFKIAMPELASHFLYPLETGHKVALSHGVFPQKNFHWSISPFSEAVAEIIAKKFNLAPLAKSLKFHECVTTSDISHIVGRAMPNKGDLCPDETAWENIKKMRWDSPDFPWKDLSRMPLTLAINPHREKGCLIVGDSFGWTLLDVLSLYFGETMYLEYYAFERIYHNDVNAMQKALNLLAAYYNYDYLIIISHNYYFPISENHTLAVLLK